MKLCMTALLAVFLAGSCLAQQPKKPPPDVTIKLLLPGQNERVISKVVLLDGGSIEETVRRGGESITVVTNVFSPKTGRHRIEWSLFNGQPTFVVVRTSTTAETIYFNAKMRRRRVVMAGAQIDFLVGSDGKPVQNNDSNRRWRLVLLRYYSPAFFATLDRLGFDEMISRVKVPRQ